MRKFLISTAVLASMVVAAAPAAAQWQQPNGYANGYNNRGQARRLEVRVMQLRREIAQLDRRNVLSNSEARRLEAEARNLEQRVRQQGYNGLSQRERHNIEQRIARLEQNIRRQANDGNRGYNNRSSANDRDRDGRIDRYEDDRGRIPG